MAVLGEQVDQLGADQTRSADDDNLHAVLYVKPPKQQTKEPHMTDAASQPRSTARQNAVTVLQEATPPSIPDRAHAMTIVIDSSKKTNWSRAAITGPRVVTETTLRASFDARDGG